MLDIYNNGNSDVQGTLDMLNESNEYTKFEMLETILNNLTIVPNQNNKIMQTLTNQKENLEYDKCFLKNIIKLDQLDLTGLIKKIVELEV
jgi:hypothetical protein